MDNKESLYIHLFTLLLIVVFLVFLFAIGVDAYHEDVRPKGTRHERIPCTWMGSHISYDAYMFSSTRGETYSPQTGNKLATFFYNDKGDAIRVVIHIFGDQEIKGAPKYVEEEFFKAAKHGVCSLAWKDYQLHYEGKEA